MFWRRNKGDDKPDEGEEVVFRYEWGNEEGDGIGQYNPKRNRWEADEYTVLDNEVRWWLRLIRPDDD